MRLVLDKTKENMGSVLIVNLPFEMCEIQVIFDRDNSSYCLIANFERFTHYLFSNSSKAVVLDEYNKLFNAYLRGDSSYTFTWN